VVDERVGFDERGACDLVFSHVWDGFFGVSFRIYEPG
jgi:hypothetical protein